MPKGKAGEYSKYACNFYKGCSNGCTYCYLKKGVLAHELGGDKPVLKSCFKDEHDAIDTYFKELFDNGKTVKEDIKKHGIFFTFTSDPFLRETAVLNSSVIGTTLEVGVPVQILTKCTSWVDKTIGDHILKHPNARNLLSVGFTLTGCDDIEPNASPNAERIEAMKRIHEMGIRTWASIEPIIDLEASRWCISETLGFCDEYKIGLLSGKRNYTKEDVADFVKSVEPALRESGAKVYWKESVRKFIGKEEQR